MTQYLSITPYSPIDVGVDDNGRPQRTINIEAQILAYSTQFEEELASILSGAGLGTLGTDIFTTSNAKVPVGDGPFIVIVDTGGPQPMYTHGEDVTIENRTAMIHVRARSSMACRQRSMDVFQAIRVVNQTV